MPMTGIPETHKTQKTFVASRHHQLYHVSTQRLLYTKTLDQRAISNGSLSFDYFVRGLCSVVCLFVVCKRDKKQTRGEWEKKVL